MNAAELTLRAAQRIMLTNERHLTAMVAQSRRATAAMNDVECRRLRERIGDAEVAARAAGRQLAQIEAELNHATHTPRSGRVQPPESGYALASRYGSSSPRAGRRAAGSGGVVLPPTRGHLERQRRAAEQMVRAQLRVATHGVPVVVRPSRR